MKLPNFFLVGAPRCGTTALYTYLSQHPEIYMSPIKEPQFFANFLGEHRCIREWSEYLRCFAAAERQKKVGEASVAYLAAPNAAADIKTFSPEARILIMLRNPLEVMHSLYHLRRFANLEDQPTFASALEADERGRSSHELTYRQRVNFVEQVERYIQTFGRDRVHIIIYDDFKSDTASVYRKTLEFLDLRTDFCPPFPIVNANPRARSQVLWNFTRHPPTLLRSVIRPFTSIHVRRCLGNFLLRLNVVYEKRPAIAPELKARLNADFALEVKKLSVLTGRDLSAWCQA